MWCTYTNIAKLEMWPKDTDDPWNKQLLTKNYGYAIKDSL